MNFNANSGTIQTKKLHITNHEDHRVAYQFIGGDYQLSQDGKAVRKPRGSVKNSSADWISISPAILEINPNETASVDVLITVPQGENETRWSILYVEPTKEKTTFSADKNLGTGVIVKPRIAVMINQSPKNNTNYSAKIGNLIEITKTDDEFRKFEVTVKNIGDKIIDAKLALHLANLETAKEEKFDATKGKVYPNASKTFTISLPVTLEKGQHALAIVLDYGHGNLEGVQQIITEE